jgi:hypothetical protein
VSIKLKRAQREKNQPVCDSGLLNILLNFTTEILMLQETGMMELNLSSLFPAKQNVKNPDSTGLLNDE